MDIVTLSMAKAYSDKKGGYIAKNKNFIVTGDTKNFVASEETGGLPIHLYGVSLGHPSCFRCDVTWDGKEYICSVAQNEDALYVGNNAIIGFGDDTGEPFLIISDFNKNTTLMVATEAGEHSFSLYEYYETIVPIDPKFLPPMGGGLPFVKLTTEPAADGVRLTDEESAAIRAAWTDGLPAVISFAYYGTPVSGVFSCFGGVYTMTSFGVNFSVEDTDGGNLTFSVIEP